MKVSRHLDVCHWNAHGPIGLAAANPVATSAQREVDRLCRAVAAHESEKHGAAGLERRCSDVRERLQALHAVECAEVRHDAVERLPFAKRSQKHRELLQAARHHGGPLHQIAAAETAERTADHRLRWIARNHANATGNEKGGVDPGAAADLEDAMARTKPAHEYAVRTLS